jgi:hypothetical protein
VEVMFGAKEGVKAQALGELAMRITCANSSGTVRASLGWWSLTENSEYRID